MVNHGVCVDSLRDLSKSERAAWIQYAVRRRIRSLRAVAPLHAYQQHFLLSHRALNRPPAYTHALAHALSKHTLTLSPTRGPVFEHADLESRCQSRVVTLPRRDSQLPYLGLRVTACSNPGCMTEQHQHA